MRDLGQSRVEEAAQLGRGRCDGGGEQRGAVGEGRKNAVSP
ncbi:hypothetical protein SGLAM104S_10605 [Streptomyces glaucescens]